MAKDCEKKGVSLTKLLLTAAVVLAGCVSAFTVVKIQAGNNGKNIETNKAEAKENVKELEKDGCKPAQENKSQMKVVEYRLGSIDKTMEDFRTEQQVIRKETKEGFEAILKKL